MQLLSYLLLTLFISSQFTSCQAGNWRRSDRKGHDSRSRGEAWVRPLRGAYFELDYDDIKAALDSDSGVISLPYPDGSLHQFNTYVSEFLAPELEAKLPNLYVFRLLSTEDADVTGTGDYSDNGFHAQIFTEQGTIYIDPYTRGDTTLYTSHYVKDLPTQPLNYAMKHHNSGFHPTSITSEMEEFSRNVETLGGRGSIVHVTYRLAVCATAEYVAFFGSTTAALQQVVVTFNRVCAIFEREFGISLQMVAGNDQLMFTSSSQYVSGSPLSNTDGIANINNAAANINAKIGNTAYDVGHTLTTGQSGGVAYVGVVCIDTYKAGGSSGISRPTGDGFASQVVAHEMGHQHGCVHTFNGLNDNSVSFNGYCTPDQFQVGVEPGSGSTIMSYAGSCGNQNIQSTSDDYFNTRNLRDVSTYVFSKNGAACGSRPAGTRAAPTVTVEGGGVIPKSTPFVLSCSGNSAAGDVLYYNWEEIDTSVVESPIASPTGNAPLFRSVYPSSTGNVRFFPRLSAVTSGTPFLGEMMPTYNRTLGFRCTARDRTGIQTANSGNYGLYGDADVTFVVLGTAGPFTVTYPSAASLTVTSPTLTVTWNVAGTNVAPISVSQVDIFLSTNSGATWYGTTPLAYHVPNTGSATVTLPQPSSSTTARIIVQAVHNSHFFDMSNSDFTLNVPAASGCSGDGDCTSPPACFTTTGASCNVGTGVCSYPTAAADDSVCSSGGVTGYCSSSQCKTCNNVVCNSPPQCYSASGSCSAGRCSYNTALNSGNCVDGSNDAGTCNAGTCVTCASVTCNSPTSPCQQASGTCSAGVCAYAWKATGDSCTGAASALGKCDASHNCVTCASMTCTPGPCQTAPTCADGVCAFSQAAIDSACSVGSSAGYCNSGGTCVTCPQTCNSGPTCQTVGTCSAGRCSYSNSPFKAACTTADSVSGKCNGQGSCVACSGSTAPTCNSPGVCEQSGSGVCSLDSSANTFCSYSAMSVGSSCTGAGGASGTCDASRNCVVCTAAKCTSAPVCKTNTGASCVNGVCSYPNLASGTTCSDGGAAGKCNGQGKCVTCTNTPCTPSACQTATCASGVCTYKSNCPTSTNNCQTNPGTCTNGVCVYGNQPTGTACIKNALGGTLGYCSAGTCSTCASTTCNKTPPTCKVATASTCTPTVCNWANAALNTVCPLTGSVNGLCSGSGSCVACLSACAPQTCKVATTCSLTASLTKTCTYANAPENTACTITSTVSGRCTSGRCCAATGGTCSTSSQCCSNRCGSNKKCS